MTTLICTERLAQEGGEPIRKEPFRPWPLFTEHHIQTVGNILRSGRVNYWTGEEGRLFEKEYAAFLGTKHAIAVANGTVALELALYSLGVGRGDEVIVTSRSFVASASCAVARGATPVFADVDINSQNISADSISRVITARTKAIIAVHLAGWPCEMDSIMALAEERGIKVVEDCACRSVSPKAFMQKAIARGVLFAIHRPKAFSMIFCNSRLSPSV